MTASGYWQPIARERLSRRRALAGVGVAGASIALAATIGCRGGDGEGEGRDGGSSLVTKPEDTSKSAKPGGVYRDVATADIGSVDPHLGTGEQVTGRTYPQGDVWRKHNRRQVTIHEVLVKAFTSTSISGS